MPFMRAFVSWCLLFVCTLAAAERLTSEGYAMSVFAADGTPVELAALKQAEGKGGGGNDIGMVGFVRILYVRVNFPDDMREFVTQAQAERDCRDVADFFAENSYGAVNLAFDVTPLITEPRTYMHYRESPRHVMLGDGTMQGDAYALARRMGYTGLYSLLVVSHRPMFMASDSSVQVQGPGAAVLAHEIGHNMGAGHSNRWYCDGIGSYTSRDWRRFGNGSPNPNNQGRVFNIYETHCVPYGDPFCNMGGGSLGHWSTFWKFGYWIPLSHTRTVTGSGRFRLTAYDYPRLEPGLIYAIKVPRNHQQDYYLGFRCRQWDGRSIPLAQSNHKWLPNSLLIQGGLWDSAREENTPPSPNPHLIDTTPGSPSSLNAAVGTTPPIDGNYIEDCGLVVGRTYTDAAADLHITVVDKVQTEPQALDVVINRGTSVGNRPPTLTIRPRIPSLVGSSGQVRVPIPVGATQTAVVEFVATASDPDGDQLAYHWDFGDCSNGSQNAPDCSHAWLTSDVGTGRLMWVRCTVSDMKGGIATANLPVNINLPEFTGTGVGAGRTRFWANGRVLDQAGLPLQGARVTWVGSPMLWSFTDSAGYFQVPNLPDGDHKFDVTLEGYRFIGVNNASSDTITFAGRDLDQIDFVGYVRQHIRVEAVAPSVAAGERPVWKVTRTVAQTGTFGKPAAYTQPIDFLNQNGSGTQLEQPVVRLYSDAGGLKWSTSNLSQAAWGGATDVADLEDININTPENISQYRRETVNTAVNNVPDANPTGDRYIRFPAGVDTLYVAGDPTGTPTAATHYVDSYHLLAAFGVDYVPVVEEAAVTVSAAMPATPTLTLRADGGTSSEDGTYIASFTVVSDIPAPTRLVIPLAYTPGTADLADLAAGYPATVVLEPDQTEATFAVRAAEDRLREGVESLSISLTADPGWALGAATQTLSIMDGDYPRVRVSCISEPARELDETSAGPVAGVFCIRRQGNVEQELVVNVATSGTATSGTDYLAVPATITIPAGRYSVDVPVTPISDGATEGDETIILTLKNGLDYQVSNAGSAVLVLQDAQLPDVGLAVVGGTTLTELPSSSTTLRFTRYRSTVGDLTVTFSVSGTADYGLDYTLSNMPQRGTCVIPNGAASVDCVLTTSNNGVREIKTQDNEYAFFRVMPDPLGKYNVWAQHDDAAVTITDDDGATTGATVSWEFPTATVREGDTLGIDIVLSDWPVQPIDTNNPDPNLFARVDWAVMADGTGAHPASVPGDVGALSGTVTILRIQSFADEERRAHISIPITADTAAEFSETFRLVLSNPRPTSGSPVNLPQILNGSDNLAECLVTIIDDDAGAVSVSLDAATVIEGAATVLHVARTGSTAQALTVGIEMQGTAVPGADFQQFGAIGAPMGDTGQLRLVIIPAGATETLVTIQTIADTVDQTDRVVEFRAASAAGYTVPAGGWISLAITDDDVDTRPLVTIVATDPFASETGPDAATITLTRTGPVASALTVPLVIGLESTVGGGDCGAIPASIVFAPGSATATFTVTPVDDALVEDTETLIIALSAASSANYQPGEPSHATIWIADNDRDDAIVRIDTAIATVNEEEGATQGRFARFLLRRTKEERGPLTLVTAVGGTAINGTDYTVRVDGVVSPSLGTIAFAAGATELTVDIIPSSDTDLEGDETVILTVSDGVGYEAEPTASAATATIIDDDAPSISIVAGVDANETGPVSATFILTRSGGNLAAGLSVDVALSGGATDPCTPGTDTAVTTVVAGFLAGETTATISIAPVDDATAEADETLVATVIADANPPTGWVVGTPASAQVRILDDDRARVSLSLLGGTLNADGSLDIYENGAPNVATLRFTRTAPTAADLIVTYSLGGSAATGADYTTSSAVGTVTILAGNTFADVTLTAVDDVLIESPETVIATLGASTQYNIGGTDQQINIVSDDGVRVGIVGPPNHLIGTFSGPLTFRFYRLGSAVGPLHVNYSVVPDADATTTDLVNTGTSFSLLSGYFDMADGQTTYDLTITFTGYVADARRFLTIQVDTPVIAGSYTPGGVPGIAGGLGSATCQILRTTDTNVARLRATDAGATEGNADTASMSVDFNLGSGVARTVPIDRIPAISTADNAIDYNLSANPATVGGGATATTVTLTAPRDFSTDEGPEVTILQLRQPTAVAPADPAFWVVGLPKVFTIQDGPAPMPLMVALRGAKRLIDGNQDAISGILAYGTPISYTYQLTNDGDLPLIITGWSETLRTNLAPLAPTFSAAFPQTLAPGASVTMTVPVNPVASGVWRVGFSFTTNEAASPFDFSLIGNAASTASSGSVNDSYQGTAGNTACGSGGFAGLLLGIGALALGLRRRRR